MFNKIRRIFRIAKVNQIVQEYVDSEYTQKDFTLLIKAIDAVNPLNATYDDDLYAIKVRSNIHSFKEMASLFEALLTAIRKGNKLPPVRSAPYRGDILKWLSAGDNAHYDLLESIQYWINLNREIEAELKDLNAHINIRLLSPYINANRYLVASLFLAKTGIELKGWEI